MMKRILSLVLVFLVLSAFSLAENIAPLQPTADSSASQYALTIAEALRLKIAWKGLAEKQGETITLKEAVDLLQNSVAFSHEGIRSSYLNNYLQTHSADAALQRYQLAELIWGSYREIQYNTFDLMPMPQINAGYVKLGMFDSTSIWECPDIQAIDACTDATGCNYAIMAYDRVTGEKIMSLFEDYTFRPNKAVTVSDAVASALHYARSFEDEPQYVVVAKVGGHTIAPVLYAGETSLPDATNQKLPRWRGLNLSHESMLVPGSLSGRSDDRTREADIDYLKSLGANFMHLYLSWSYFQGPDYTCDSKVNLTRLNELDQIIAWCMERDIHIQLVFNDVPNIDGSAVDLDQWRELSSAVFTDTTVRDTVTQFWRMLARRYSDIPNNYLSFNLMNECNPSDDDAYVWGFQDAVNAIWEESPGRVIVADIHGDNFTGEGMAKLGCALSYHLYAPRTVTVVTQEQEDAYPGYYENLQWPACIVNAIVYGPSASRDFPKLVKKPIVIKGDIGGATLTIKMNDLSSTDTTLKITADKKVLYNGMEAYQHDLERDWISVTDPITVTIPDKAKTLNISCPTGYAFSMADLSLTLANGVTPNIMLAMDYWKGTPNAQVSVFSDGTFESSLSIADIRMGTSLNQLIELGKKRHVAVMVGEFGIFELDMPSFGIPQQTVDAIMRDQVALFDSLDLAWSCEYVGRYAPVVPAPHLADVAYQKVQDTPYYENPAMRTLYDSLIAGDE